MQLLLIFYNESVHSYFQWHFLSESRLRTLKFNSILHIRNKMGNNIGVVHASETPAPAGDCPVQGAEGLDPRNMMPPANQLPAPNQPFPLPTERQKSSIPRSGTEDNWVYPSQQMFYNALLRKGWEFGPDDLEQSDMDHIIKIHNANNESAWEEVDSTSSV